HLVGAGAKPASAPEKRVPARVKQPLVVPVAANLCWSLDFTSDVLTDSRRFRTLNVLDGYNRQLLGVEIDFSLPASQWLNVMLLTIPPTANFPQNPATFTGKRKNQAIQERIVGRVFFRKRIFDFVFAALVLVLLLSWFIPLIAVLIKLESKGPVFFKQLRTGKQGKPFYCFKFRSMKVNAEADTRQASRSDNRVTRIGAFLRKTSLDELPQFINVIKGEMSIVGPRPHMIQHTELYSQTIHNFMDRHLIMPGITGLAQVSGYRGETKELSAMANRVNADIQYIYNMSGQLDLKIIYLTVWQPRYRDANTTSNNTCINVSAGSFLLPLALCYFSFAPSRK
nr:exopolysaccharide production protein PSS, putative [Tanacetum cinerariifolium]